MAATQHVTLTELLEVQDDAISEINGWSLLRQSVVTLLESKGSQSSWLITPDTMLLYRSGAVKFCPGIPNVDGNNFIAPELYGMKQFHTIDELERTYVYSLGMTIYYALEYRNDGQEIGSERPLEAVLNKMTIEAADERISLDLVYKACKDYQDKNTTLIFSNKISRMVESVLGGQLEFSYDLPDMDDESLERELQHAASMKTSSERLSSCGATGSSQSLSSSQQGMFSSTSSFRRVARHHSNLSIRSLGSSSHEWSAGLAASHPLPSQRWSSYDGLHVPPPLNPAALSFEGRRQLPASPTIAQSITTRRHSVSQEAAHMMHGGIRGNEEQKLSRPKSADMSSNQETMTLSNDDKSLNNFLELPQLHPPPLKKFLLPLDTPPSPAPIAKMSPKVAASLEKINQLLASNPPLQQANGNNLVTSGSNRTAVEPLFVSSVTYHKFPPSPLLNGPLPTADGDEVDVVEEKAPPVPPSSPPDEMTTNLSNVALCAQSSANNFLFEDSTVNVSSISSSHSKQQMHKTSIQELASPASFPYADSSQKENQEINKHETMEQYHDKHRTSKQHEHLSLQQEQLKKYGEHQQQLLQQHQQQQQEEDRHDRLQQQQCIQEQQHKQKIQQWQSKEQYQQQQQEHEQQQQQHEHEEEQQQRQQQQQRHEQEQQRGEQEQHEQEQQQRHEQEQQQRHEQEQQQRHEQEQQQRHEQEQQQRHEQEQQQRHEQEQQQRHEQEQQQRHEQEQQQRHEQEQQQRYEQEQQQPHEQEQQQRYEQEQQQRHEQEQQERYEQEQQQRYEQEQQQRHEQEQQQRHEQEQQQRHEQEQQQRHEQEQQHEQQLYEQQQPGGNEIFVCTSMKAEKSVTPENTQMVSTYYGNQVGTEEEPGYATVADTKRMVKVLKLATPYAVTELSRAHSEHQIDKNELLQPLAKRTDSVAEQLDGIEYNQAHNKQVKYSATKNDAMSVKDNSSNNFVDVSASITTQDDCNIKLSASSHDHDEIVAHPLSVKDTTDHVTVTVFPSTLQNDDDNQPEEHSIPTGVNALKVDKKEEEGLNANSDEVKLRHTLLQTSGLLVKSSSTQDFKDSGAEVNDPRRHSALPAARDFGSDAAINDVPDPTAKSKQLVVGEKFEPTYDEDWRQLQEVTSVEKLENVLGPEFTSLVGGKWERTAQPILSYGVNSNRRHVNVVLLNDKIYSVTVELSSKCQDVFNQVVSYLSLGEPHVFGLSIVKGEEDYFLDLNKRLIKYAPDGWVEKTASSVRNPRKAPPVFTVYFRIRFFVENVHELKMNQTRHQYYLQLRRDIQLEKVYCHEETALLLASYSLQVEKGDYGPTLEGKEYYKLEDYMPQKAIDRLTKDKINSVLPHMHSELKGVSKESVEWQFLQEVQKLTEYGQIFYQLYKEQHKRHCTVAIGFCIRGLVLYDTVNKDTKIPTHKLSWKQIENIVFKQRRFELHITGNDEPLVYYVSSPKKALYLFGLAKSYHYFQLKCREPIVTKSESAVEEPPRQKHEQCEVIKLLKEPGTGLGFKIMSGKKKENREGIFVKSIIKGTPAYLDGRMKPFDQIVAINGESVAGCDHRDVGCMVHQSPPLIQITVIHHHHDEEERLLNMSYNKRSPLSNDPTVHEQQSPTPTLSRPNYDDDTKYRTVLITKDNDHLGFSVKGSVRGVYVSNLEPGTATARKKLLQVGSVIVAVNGQSVEGQTVHEVLQLLLSSHYQLELTIQLPTDYSSKDDDIYVEGDQFVVNIDRRDEDDFGLQIVKRATSDGPPSGLFFVKSLIPGSPAYYCNKLMENDIILQVNDKYLKNCTNEEARQVLYKAGQHVSLLVCRSVITMLSNSPSFVDAPHSSHTSVRDIATPSHGSHTSTGDTTTPPHSSHTSLRDTGCHGSHTSINDTHSCHEVEINVTLIKGEAAFGFKIDKHLSGQTGRGVFILAVDSEPALSDGRLHQGDEIIKVNDINLIDRPHQTAIYALRQIRPFEKADLVIRRRLKVEEFDVSFYKEKVETTLGLVVGEKTLPYDQEQQTLGVTILQIHSGSLSGENGLLHIGDVINKINDVQVSSVDKAVKMLKEAIGNLTLHIFRYPISELEVNKPQPILLPSEEPLSSLLTADHVLPPLRQEIITVEDTSVSVEDTLPSERSSTPPPPSSSPPPLSPAKGDNSCDNAEEWTEPQLHSTQSGSDHKVDSCSSPDSSDAEDIFNEIDQSANHSNLSATVAKGMNDSLGTLSNLSEDYTGADLLTESHNSMYPPPLPLSPPPDL